MISINYNFMKNTYLLDISDKSITLEILNNGSKKAATIPIVLAFIAFLLPFFIMILIISSEYGGISFGFLLACLIVWIPGGYLLRLGLWNKYGREVFVVEKKKFTHYNDYKYFKDNYKEKDYNEIEIGEAFNIGEENDRHSAYIIVSLDGEVAVHSHKKIPVSVIKEINESLVRYLYVKHYL